MANARIPSHGSTPNAAPAASPIESVAGEEDPGASLDTQAPAQTDGAAGASAGTSDQPAGSDPKKPYEPAAPVSPGDEAPPGTPGTGENICPRCGGTGRFGSNACPDCGGTGKVTVGIGGA